MNRTGKGLSFDGSLARTEATGWIYDSLGIDVALLKEIKEVDAKLKDMLL